MEGRTHFLELVYPTGVIQRIPLPLDFYVKDAFTRIGVVEELLTEAMANVQGIIPAGTEFHLIIKSKADEVDGS